MAGEFKPGDRVRVKDLPNLIKKVRGAFGTVGDEPQPGWCLVALDVMDGKKFAFEYDQIELAPPDHDDDADDLTARRAAMKDVAVWLENEGRHKHARHIRGGIKALETAPRERDEARADGEQRQALYETWGRELSELAERWRARALAAESALSSEESSHAETRKALEPFATAADDLYERTLDRDHLWESPAAMSITAGDLRRARASLSPTQDR